jgi:hypothetical protein
MVHAEAAVTAVILNSAPVNFFNIKQFHSLCTDNPHSEGVVR